MSEEEQLKLIRDQIDSIDKQILDLICDRARCANKVAEVKSASVADPIFYRPEREAQVLRRLMEVNEGPLPDKAVAQLFREIISACLALEQPMRVAYLGPEGTFTQAAVQKHFGHAVGQSPQSTIEDVFRAVESGQAMYGVVPVENSTEGVVNYTLDMFMRSPIRICGEVVLRIQHNLVGNCQDLSQVKRVFSHQQSLAQCRNWLDVNLPHAERISVSSNAEAAKMAVSDAEAVAISGASAAEIYEVEMLVPNIEDEPNNTTRFLILGDQAVLPSGSDKTTILTSTRNKPGALHQLLLPFSENGVDMTRIESRPSRSGLWEYVFFIDIEGHQNSPDVSKALIELQENAALYRVLGSYPKAVY